MNRPGFARRPRRPAAWQMLCMAAPLATTMLAATLLAPAPALAQEGPPVSLSDAFRIGNAGVVCQGQARLEDGSYQSLFDRAYDIHCTDAASPVGKLLALRPVSDAAARLASLLPAQISCQPATRQAELFVQQCQLAASGLGWRRYWQQAGGRLYVAQGLAAYDAALRLGLQSLITDTPQPGRIEVATTGAGDPLALARVQAGQLDPAEALAAAYQRANAGSYAEASQYFDTLAQRARTDPRLAGHVAEYLGNLAMQQSVLGNRAEADRLFARAEAAAAHGEALGGVQLRNLVAMHRLNSGDPQGALVALDRVIATGGAGGDYDVARLSGGFIDQPIAQRLTADDAARGRFWGAEPQLSDAERAQLLKAQALYIRGGALRVQGHSAQAEAALAAASADFVAVRGGRVRSMGWLAASIALERAQLAEQAGRIDEAGRQYEAAITAYGRLYPDSAALLAVEARRAEFLARRGARAQALAAFGALVREAGAISGGNTAMSAHLGAYFDLLLAKDAPPEAMADLFRASQLTVRPGVAQSQEVLARELSAGSDEAADLFRQSVNTARELVRLDGEIANLETQDLRDPATQANLASARANRQRLADTQTGLQARLADFPRFRAVNDAVLELGALQAMLAPGEAYYKLVMLPGAAYGLFITHEGARGWKLAASPAQLETISNQIRDSIVAAQGNQLVTGPFDAAAARQLYVWLLGPAAGEMAGVHHLVFEPDGPLLKLPASLLITDEASLAAYQARQAQPGADPFDMTGIAWLGRGRIVSTAVSPRAFAFVRAIKPSTAPGLYLGLGQNTKASASPFAPPRAAPRDPCDWPLSLWNHPVNGAELGLAAKALGEGRTSVITGEGFADTTLRSRADLKDYRVVQFATHGLVTAPRPGCPARPALVTSFGPGQSQGLLSFADIFDMRLNADTVVLSACDTAGAASAAATREAGIPTGGNFALDGLVRAFIGAGARSVIASHWPVPDDFNATARLIGGFYQAARTQPVGEAMRQAQMALMDDPLTSHPYYWAAFAIVGDATKPLTSR